MEKKKSSPIPAGNSSLDFSSGTSFLFLPTRYGGFDYVLFDDGQKDMPLDVTVNFYCLIFRIPSTIDTLLEWHCQKI